MHNNYNLVAVDFDPFEGNEIEKVIPTNEPQREVWLSCFIGGNEANLAYNESVSFELNGLLDQALFLEAIEEVTNRHEALRANISANGESLIIYNQVFLNVAIEDISAITDKKKWLATFIDNEMQRVFDLQNGPLFRVYLHKLNDEHYFFTIVLHHIIADGWSLGVILEDISKIYNAKMKGELSVSPKPPQISEYVEEMLTFEHSAHYQQTLAYWLDMYREDIPVLNLATDYPRPGTRTYTSKRIDQKISLTLIEQLKKTGVQSGCSLVNVLLNAFEIFIYQQSGQNDIVVGLPSAGQAATEKLGLVGHCVNLLPLRTIIDPNISFADYLGKRKRDLLDAFDHQKFTFGQLVKNLNIKRDPSRVPLVSVLFNVDMGMDSAVMFERLEHRLISNPRASETFEISLNLTASKSEYIMEWSYNTHLFAPETIKKMTADFEELLKDIVRNPSILIKKLNSKIVDSWDIQLKQWNNTVFPYDKNLNLTEIIQQNALKFNSKTAVSFKDQEITYRELVQLTNQLANYLLQNGVKKGDIVGLATDRSIEMVVSLLAIMKAGAAYLPVDPEFPQDRIEYMLADSGASLLMVSELYKGRFKSDATELVIEDFWQELNNLEDKDPQTIIEGVDLAYILYTSGSTGKPKGVKIMHYNLINFLISMQMEPGINEEDILLAITTISFDIAGLELYLPLISGAKLVICDKETARDGRLLLDLVENQKISIMQATPSTWRMMLESGWNKTYQLKVLCGGEPLPKDLANQLMDKCTALWNMYGPTETTIWSTVKKIEEDENITIGRPIKNTQIYILGKNNELLCPGNVGEICIGGDGLAAGYHGQETLTEEKFILNPFHTNTRDRIYKTGDLGKFLDNGEIICLGRIDQQVKIRGHRIELGEIEYELSSLDEVAQAVVTVRDDRHSLTAYLILNNELSSEMGLEENIVFASKADIDKWKYRLKQALPDYMIPLEYVILKDFPLTPNNKIDKKALSKLGNNSNSVVCKFKESKSKDEQLITDIWSNILNIKKIHLTDDFFELGGHSLLAVKVMIAIEEKTGKRLPIASLFENPTIEKLAKLIYDDNIKWDSLVPIKTSGKKRPLYIVHGWGLNVLGFLNLANALDKEQPVYGLQAKGLNGKEVIFQTTEEIAAHYVDEIIHHNPSGPYLLSGYSSGGVIAFEMSKQLKALGREVAFLAFFDSFTTINDFSELKKQNRVFPYVKYIVKKIAYNFIFFIRNPVAVFIDKYNFITGTMYNIYAHFKPKNKSKIKNAAYLIRELQEAHDRSLKNYTFAAYDGHAYLFKGNDPETTYYNYYKTNGWKPFIKQGITKVEVPIKHLVFFEPKYVSILAEKVQSELDKLDID